MAEDLKIKDLILSKMRTALVEQEKARIGFARHLLDGTHDAKVAANCLLCREWGTKLKEAIKKEMAERDNITNAAKTTSKK